MKIQRSLMSLAIFFLIMATVSPMAHAQQLKITSPVDGTIVAPGQTIEITTSHDAAVGSVGIFTSQGLPRVKPGPSANSVVLIIPSKIIPFGTYTITALGTTGGEDRVNIIIQRPDDPVSMQFDPDSTITVSAKSRSSVSLYGFFSDGNKFDIICSPKTKLSTANTKIAQVTTKDGIAMLNGISPGGTTLTATYGNLSTTVPVIVPLGNATPVYKVTATPTGAVSKDVSGNYAVNVNITNNSNDMLALLTLASATLNQANATSLPAAFTQFDPGTSKTVKFTFPRTAGTSGTQATLQLKGTYEGPLQPPGVRGQQGAINFSFRVRLP